MLNNITLGQYYPTGSPVHKMDPRAKLIVLILFYVSLFVSSSIWSLAAPAVFLLFAVYMARLPFKVMLRSLKPLRFILILTFIRQGRFSHQLKTKHPVRNVRVASG